MASRYWVGGSGNWDNSDTTHWAATSGGTGGQSTPTSVDDVFVDTLSGTTPTITMQSDINILSFLSSSALSFVLDTNDYAMTIEGKFSANTVTANTVLLKSATHTFKGAGVTFFFSGVNGGTSTMYFNNTTNTALALTTMTAGNNFQPNNIWFDRGASTANISLCGTAGTWSCNIFKDTGTAAHILGPNTAGQAMNLSCKSFIVNGSSASSKITLRQGISATYKFNITKLGGGIVICDNVILNGCTGTPATNTFFATHVTNTLSTGWNVSGNPPNFLPFLLQNR